MVEANKFTAFIPEAEKRLICMECGRHYDEHFMQRMSCANMSWHKEVGMLVSALMKIEDIPNHPDLVPPNELVKWMQDRARNALTGIGKENEN